MDPAGIVISAASNYQENPSIAFDGTNYLVTWQDNRSGVYDIYGTRVNQAGTVLDPAGLVISAAANIQTSPSVAFDGTNYLVIWDDFRSGISHDIYGAHVNPAGAVIDTIVISMQTNNQISPALAHGSGNQVFITYSGYTDYINSHPANTMRIWGTYYPLIAIEENTTLNELNMPSLLQAYPNPVHGACVLKYAVQNKGVTKISVYDITGRLVIDLVNETQFPGIYYEQFDLTGLTPGVYCAVFRSRTRSVTAKILLIK